jgi:oligopeptide transport system substrate-binding protein
MALERKQRALAFALALGAVLALAGCGRTDEAREAAEQGILLLGNGSDPMALDPHLVASVGDSNILRALFEGLVTYHPEDDGRLEPGVAESWEANADFTVWTFRLRDNARWSNGDAVTARDFVTSWRRILEPDLASPYASMLYLLQGGKAYNEGKTRDFGTVGVKAPDDRTLVCTLELPAPYFPQVVKHTSWLPVHGPTIERHGKLTDRFTKWQRPGNHVSNGPFRLKSWRIYHSVVVEKNLRYWDADRVSLREIRFFPYETYAEARAFRGGRLHYTYTLPPELIQRYREEKSPMLRLEPYYGAYFFRCNVAEERPDGSPNPLADVRVRRALAFAIDRRALVDHVTRADQTPAFGFTPPTAGGYVPPDEVRFDPDQARALLAEAGYPGGKGFPGFAILINTSEAHRAIAEALQDMWRRHLGLGGVKIENMEWNTFQSEVIAGRYDVSRAGWIADYLDPATFLDLWRTGDSNNNTGWSDPRYDRILDEAARQGTAEARYAKLREAETILLEAMPVLPVYWYTRSYLLRPEVKNWNPLLLDNHNYKFIRLEAGAGP